MGSDKRERQKLARFEKIEAEEKAARRTRSKRAAIRTAVAVVVIVGGLGIYTLLAGDDGNETAADDETTTSSTPPSTVVAPPECAPPSGPALDLAEDVADREAPDPAPPAADTPAEALDCQILFEGGGEGAAAGDTIVAEYVGKLPDGTVFDSSWTPDRPDFSVALATGQVIPGWDSGLIGAKVGERRRLVIGSTYAYGEQGGGDRIPPNTPLSFEVDIVDVLTPEEAATTTTTAPAAPAPPASG